MKGENNKQRRNRGWTSPRKQKVLALLTAGLALGLTRSYNKQRWIWKTIPKELKNIDRRYLHRIIHEFHHHRLVDYKEYEDGSIKIVITEKGKERSLVMDLDNLKISHKLEWDQKWRLVCFDIPEKKRRIRDALRIRLHELGFYELQHSIFVHPYPCRDEIDFIAEVLEARPYIIYIETLIINPDATLRLHFKLKP